MLLQTAQRTASCLVLSAAWVCGMMSNAQTFLGRGVDQTLFCRGFLEDAHCVPPAAVQFASPSVASGDFG